MATLDKSNSETSESSSPELALQSDLKMLRDRVDYLQLDAVEKRRPWYRHASTVLSVLALIVSLMTFVLGQRFEKQRAAQEQLSDVITKLIDERKERTDILKVPDANERQGELIRLENKQRIYLEEAETLISSLGKRNVVPAELTNLGYEEETTGRPEKSAKYFSTAIEMSHDPYEIWTTRVELANVYFFPPLSDFQKDRDLFELASKSCGLTPRDLAFIYDRWGKAELGSHHRNEGTAALECARLCSKMPSDDWVKKRLDDLRTIPQVSSVDAKCVCAK